MQSFENEGFSEIDAKKQAFVAILPELRKELGNVYMDRSPEMDVATEKGSCAQKNNENQRCIR